MHAYILAFCTLFTLLSCGTYDPEGIWQSTADPGKNLLILQVEEGIAIRYPESRNWTPFKKTDEQRFVNTTSQDFIELLGPDRMQLGNTAQSTTADFHRIVLQPADPKAITPNMTKEQVRKFFGAPDQVSQKDTIDYWMYPNALRLTFDTKGVVQINTNYKEKRVFADLRPGMTRPTVTQILGNPDQQSAWNRSGKGLQRWFYDSVILTFDNEGLINVEGEGIDPFLVAPASKYQVADIVNDRPAGFVIEDQHTEFLACTCSMTPEGPQIVLRGEQAEVSIQLQADRTFTIENEYTYAEKKGSIEDEKVEIMLNAAAIKEGTRIIGFIRMEGDCAYDADGNRAPCYYKGTFACTF